MCLLISLDPQFIPYHIYLIDNLLIFFHNGFEFFTWVHNSCMIASRKYIPDTFVCIVELVLEKIHCHLTWYHVFFLTIFWEECAYLDTKVSWYGLDQVFVSATTCPEIATCSNSSCKWADSEFWEAKCNIFESWWSTLEIMFSDNLIEYSFDLTNIGRDMFRDELCYFLIKEEFSCSRFFLDDSETSLIIWFTDINSYSPLKPTL